MLALIILEYIDKKRKCQEMKYHKADALYILLSRSSFTIMR